MIPKTPAGDRIITYVEDGAVMIDLETYSLFHVSPDNALRLASQLIHAALSAKSGT